jgi:hypothetical protein
MARFSLMGGRWRDGFGFADPNQLAASAAPGPPGRQAGTAHKAKNKAHALPQDALRQTHEEVLV